MKTTMSRKVFCVINTVIMAIIIVTCLYPVLYVFFASFSDAAQLMNTSGFLIRPAGFSLDAYKSIFSNDVILNGYKNTLFILVVGTSINLIMTIAAAYVLSSRNVYWKPAIMMFIIITMGGYPAGIYRHIQSHYNENIFYDNSGQSFRIGRA